MAAVADLPRHRAAPAVARCRVGHGQPVGRSGAEGDWPPRRPSVERPSGAPPGLGLAPTTPEAAEKPVAKPKARTEVGGRSRPADRGGHGRRAGRGHGGTVPSVPAPRLPGDAPLTAQDSQQILWTVNNLPTTDPALNVPPIEPPKLALEGAADPARTGEQTEAMRKSVDEAHAQGRADAATPMGEGHVVPDVPPETLSAEVPAAAGGGAAVTAGAAADETSSIIARQERGDQIRGAARQAQSDMVASKEDHATKAAEAREKSQKDVAGEVRKNADEQTQTREGVQREVAKTRGDWTGEQTKLVTDADADAAKANASSGTAVRAERKRATRRLPSTSPTATPRSPTPARTARGRPGSSGRRRKRRPTAAGSSSWLGSKVASFFDGIKKAIVAAFEAARAAVKAAIKAAQDLAAAAIDLARKAVVAAIKLAGDALVAIGDRVLAGFPGLRDKFAKLVRSAVDLAVKAVNALANALKGVLALLNLLGKALDAYLGLLQKLYLAAVEAVAKAVNDAIPSSPSRWPRRSPRSRNSSRTWRPTPASGSATSGRRSSTGSRTT